VRAQSAKGRELDITSVSLQGIDSGEITRDRSCATPAHLSRQRVAADLID
jgi:hypothetical protein